jgi:hypothetical protein
MEANCRLRASLSNPSEETYLLPDGFFHRVGPQIRLLSVPNFGVNTISISFQNSAIIQLWWFH